MQHTENYKLNLIETSDPFSPEKLNENAQAIDAQLARVEAETARVVFGAYTGNGNSYQDIELGFKPKAVLVFDSNGATTNSSYPHGGLALPDNPVRRSNTTAVMITDNGFRVYYSSSSYIYANTNGSKYHYLAFR